MGLSISHIWIVSCYTAQNHALGHIIEERVNSTCYVLESSDLNILGFGKNGSDPELMLFDCAGKEWEDLLPSLQLCLVEEASNRSLVMFNLSPDFCHRKEAIRLNVKGFIYRNDSLDTFIKAIETVLLGDMWCPRKAIVDCLRDNNSPDTKPPDLTPRELEILKILVLGYSNEMIAEDLCISPHTVKTHLANIFKKIDVRKRHQAIHWFKNHF